VSLEEVVRPSKGAGENDVVCGVTECVVARLGRRRVVVGVGVGSAPSCRRTARGIINPE